MTSAPDVVYVVRPGEVNEELRYSIRSLSNLPHGKVWIAGYCPRWLKDVGAIPVQTRPGGHQSAKANIRAACEHPEVSEEFVYMNDDFFVMQPMDAIPAMHLGPLSQAIANAGMSRGYTRAMKDTLAVLLERGIDEPLMYDMHAPMLVTKSGMLEALDLCAPKMHERTVFGNLQSVGGTLARNHKVHRGDRGWQGWPFLSTNDSSFRSMPAGDLIRSRFSTPSPYETDPPAIQRPPRAMRRPVRYRAGNASVIRRVSRRSAA